MSDLGKIAEDLAARHYQKQGYKILERNFFPRFGKRIGELDIVCLKDQSLVFVEVKARTSNRFGSSLEAVDYRKQQKLVKTAKLYIQLHPEFVKYNPRIDVASIDIDNKAEPVIILTNAIEDLS
ncbi:MAG: YraN family protein [Candidatus Doudnabacteria bacterium]|nr:YraN family protein [Candidatus Doudnabacteria bacterium]